MTTLRVPRTSQPQQPVGIDWGNPLASGLVFFGIPSTGTVFESTTGSLASRVGTPSLSAGAKGIGAVGSSGTTYFTLPDLDKFDAVGAITVLAGIDGLSSNRAGAYLSKGAIDTSNVPFFFGRSSTSTLYLSRGGSSDWQRFVTGVQVSVPDRPCVVGVTQNGVLGAGATCKFYLDGVNAGNATGGGMANTVATPNALPVRFSGTGEKQYFAAVWNRALSDAEIKSLSGNPWQIFAPIRTPIFVGISAVVSSISRPTADVSTTGWTGTPDNTTLFTNINEAVASDTDYITSPSITGGESIIFGLSGSLAAGTWDVRYRANFVGASAQVKIHLLDGSSVSQGASGWQTVTSSYVDYTASVTTTGAATRVKIEVQ